MSSITIYTRNKDDAVLFAREMLHTLEIDCPLTMIITPERSEGYSVLFVTDIWSVDTVKTVAQNYFGLRTSISPEITLDG